MILNSIYPPGICYSVDRKFLQLIFSAFLNCSIQKWNKNLGFLKIQDEKPIFKFRVLRFGSIFLNLENLNFLPQIRIL